jgi:hypothetical protein
LNKQYIYQLLIAIIFPLISYPFAYTTGGSVTQFQGPVDPGDINQKVLKIALNVGNGGPGSQPSCTNMDFILQNPGEIQKVALYFTNQTNSFIPSDMVGSYSAPVSGSISFSFSRPNNATGLWYYWLVIDLKATINPSKKIDATLVNVTGTNGTPSFTNGALPINPPGARFTSRYYTIGSGEYYTNLKQAADSIAQFDYDGVDDIFMELTGTYSSSSETTNFSFTNHTGPANIIFRPQAGQTNKITERDAGNGIYFISFNGVKKIYFDGRPGGMGTTNHWTIRNKNTGTLATGPLAFANGASENQLLYLNIEADVMSEGIVSFQSSTGATGNINNVITNCHIRDWKTTDGGLARMPRAGIYSNGSSGKSNENTISNCRFSDIMETSSNTDVSFSILLNAFNQSWNITNNHFYQTGNYTLSNMQTGFGFIYISSGGGYTINNNKMGGRDTSLGGTPFVITGGDCYVNPISFVGAVSASSNTISGNLIGNMDITSGYSVAGFPFRGLRIEHNSNFTISNNIIGSNSTSNSLKHTHNGAAAAAFSGISITGSGTNNITNNTIAGISISGITSAAVSRLINITAGVNTVDNNIIGNTLSNDISVASNCPLYAIYCTSSSGITVTNNTFRNISFNAATENLIGVYNNTGNLTANGNTFKNISSAANNYCILIWNYGTTCTADNNTIESISMTHTGSAAQLACIEFDGTGNVSCNNNIVGGAAADDIVIAGAYFSQGIIKTGAGQYTCTGNTVRNITLTGTGTGVIALGINVNQGLATVENNVVENIKSFGTTPITTDYCALGINVYGSETGHSVKNNLVNGVISSSTSAVNTASIGIYMGQGTGTIEKNIVKNIVNFSSSNGAHVAGIRLGNNGTTGWNVHNNVFLLDNGANTNDISIYGIYDNTTGTNNIFHNIVKIAGNVTSGNANTSAIYRDASGLGTDNIKNNIFQNKRSGGTGKHYSEFSVSGGTYNSNNNYLENNSPANICNYGGTDYNLSGWQSSPVNAANSITGTATIDANGYVTSGGFVGAGTGTDLTATVPDDKVGITRGKASWMGAYEGQNITTGTISPLEYCAGGAISVPYTIGGSGSFNGGNVFTAELSDAFASFASPTPIGTLTSTTSGTIAAVIPVSTPAGTQYVVRVTSSDPLVIGYFYPVYLTVSSGIPVVPTANAASGISCGGFTANWSASAEATTYFLDVATDAAFTAFVSGYNNKDVGNVEMYNVSGLNTGTTYYYRLRAENGCGTSANSNSATVTTIGTQRVLVVSSTANGTNTDGVSLRWAITEANANCGQDSIIFGFGAGANFTINLTAVLPNITDATGVIIDGFSNYMCAIAGTVATTGGSATVTGTGTSFSAELIPGQLININGYKIAILGITNNTTLTLVSNFPINSTNQKLFKSCASPNNGTPNPVAVFNTSVSTPLNPTYKIILGNGGTVATGLIIPSGSNYNTIRGLVMQDFGDGTPSANDIAITISGNNNKVLGCYIGMDAGGTTRGTKTADGIVITGANNEVGDGTAAGANLISGMNGSLEGILISGAGATGNEVKGNIIGLQKDGSTIVAGAAQFAGVTILSSALSNTIGGNSAGEGNVISGNNDRGVYLNTTIAGGNKVSGNIIGPQADGVTNITSNAQTYGIMISSSPDNIIGGSTANERNIISANLTYGVDITGANSTSNVVKGNYIGIDKNGTTFISGSTQDYGIGIISSAYGNIIGSTSVGEGNVISGNKGAVNGFGIYLASAAAGGNTVIGNIIGPQFNGTTIISGTNDQTYGIYISSSPDNIIGGNSAGERNIISANKTGGVYLWGAGSIGNVVKGNYIGTDKTGTSEIISNTQAYGVYITSSVASNIIGGSSAGEGNLISGNTLNGVYMSSSSPSGNTVIGNIIGPQADGVTFLNAANSQNYGVQINDSPNNSIGGNIADARNIISANEEYGIYITGGASTGNIIEGNYIGPDSSGTSFITGSSQDYGILLLNTAGGGNTIRKNVISGNNNGSTTSRGIYCMSTAATGNTFVGNIIGPQADGVSYLSGNLQYTGIMFDGSRNNIVGGNSLADRNIISANESYGIYIWGSGSNGNIIKGNYIGSSNTLTGITGSDQNFGIYIASSAVNTQIGTSSANEQNIIAYNTTNGIYMIDGGTTGNKVSRNLIYNNSGKPINLNYGPSQANNGKAVPTITSASLTTVTGTSEVSNIIELYKGNTCTGYDAVEFIASVTAGGTGNWSVTGLSLSEGDFLIATATNGSNNTSEFSAGINAAGINRYWVGGAGNWNDNNHWATITNGCSNTSVPTTGNDVYFDSNSFSGPGQIITVPAGNWYMQNIQFLDVNKTPQLVGPGSLIIGP